MLGEQQAFQTAAAALAIEFGRRAFVERSRQAGIDRIATSERQADGHADRHEIRTRIARCELALAVGVADVEHPARLLSLAGQRDGTPARLQTGVRRPELGMVFEPREQVVDDRHGVPCRQLGDERATRVLAMRKDASLLLTTILWGNVAINVLLTLLVLGFQLFPYADGGERVNPTDFFLGFGHEALVAVCALMIAGQGLVRTGALEPIGRLLARAWGSAPQLSLLLTLAVMLARHRRNAIPGLGEFVTQGLPRMSGELVLFLSAGVLAAGISTAVAVSGIDLTPEVFGPSEASLLLVGMVLLSLFGIHPVISVTTASGLILPASPDPDLLAMTFLMTWAAGVCISPFSGLSLAIQGRYGINAFSFPRWNGLFVMLLLALDILVLHLM